MKTRTKQLAPRIVKKSIGADGNGSVEGYASTFDDLPDLDGDRVRPGAAGMEPFRVPMLAYHDRKTPIGSTVLTPVMEGLRIKEGDSNFANTMFAQEMRELAISKAVPAFSISFTSDDYTENEFGGLDFHKIKVYEVSLVPIPANPRALVTAAKSFDERGRAKEYVDAEPLAGTYEAVQEDVQEALEEIYEGAYISVIGTYPDRVVYTVTSYPDEGPGETETYEVDYMWRGEDDISIGDSPTAVTVSQVLTPDNDAEPEESAAPTVGVATNSNQPTLDKEAPAPLTVVKSAVDELVKDGRRNSNSDQTAIDTAHDYIVKAGATCAPAEKSAPEGSVIAPPRPDEEKHEDETPETQTEPTDMERLALLADAVLLEQ